jgi:hypothetical protein
MPETHDSRDVPQFETAEFHERPSGDACCICHRPISGTYFRINGSMACSACSEQVSARKPKDTHAAFTRALLFGLGGALLGWILYSAVGILLHLEIGYVSLAVGYLVGKAMMMGSGNIGGRRYQWLAVALTYAAVSLSAVPIGVAQYIHARNPAPQVRQHSATADQQGTPTAIPSPAESKKPTLSTAGMVLGILALYGFASPFLGLMGNPLSGAIGILILFIGVRIAWKIAAGPPIPAIAGPY